MMTLLFVLTAFLLVYAYLLYPLWMMLVWRAPAESSVSQPPEARRWPSVSVLVSAYNEQDFIAEKIRNFLRCDYPGKAEMIVVSDGSSDRTAEIARSMESERIRVFTPADRRGKGARINFAATQASGEVLVFTDANSFFREDTLVELIAPFADHSVGLVTGVSRYPDETVGSMYQRYEAMLKGLEARRGVISTADGAIYAMSRELWSEHDDRLIHEFLHPMLAAIHKRSSVVAPQAICIEHFSVENEFARQVRMVSQAALVLFRMLPALARARCWNAIFVLTSHKLLRWLTAPLLALFSIATLWLASNGGIYRLALYGELSFGLVVVGGMVAAKLGARQTAAVAYQFLRLNCAAAVGLWVFVSGQAPAIWQPRGR